MIDDISVERCRKATATAFRAAMTAASKAAALSRMLAEKAETAEERDRWTVAASQWQNTAVVALNKSRDFGGI